MSNNENNMIFVENIYTLAKLYGMKIGEVEDKAGISRGYVSRLKKGGEEVKLQSDTVKKVADVFGCSVKAILCHDLKHMCKDDLYYFDFVLKLYDDTEHRRVVWEEEDLCPEKISQEEYNNHPYKNFYRYREQTNGDGYECESAFLFDYNGENGVIKYNGLWTCKMDENVKLMLVGREIENNDEIEEYCIDNKMNLFVELYLKKGKKFIPLCASYRDNILSCKLFELQEYLFRFERVPYLTDEIKEIVDGFMGKERIVEVEYSAEEEHNIKKR